MGIRLYATDGFRLKMKLTKKKGIKMECFNLLKKKDKTYQCDD